MSDARTPGTEVLSSERQWKEAEEELRFCLERVCQDGPELRMPQQPAPQQKHAGWGATLSDKVHGHSSHRSPSLPKSPVDTVLGLLLRAMQAKFVLDAGYRRNIQNFTAAYVFTDKTAKICQVASFADGKMHVNAKVPENPTFTLTFSDGKALIALLFSPAPDVLDALLNQKGR